MVSYFSKSPLPSGSPRNKDMSMVSYSDDDLQMQPTTSLDSSSVLDDNTGDVSSLHSESEDSEGLQFIPGGLMTPSKQPSASILNRSSLSTASTVKREEDRLLMLAKHPNATDDQVRQALYEKELSKVARDSRRQEMERMKVVEEGAENKIAPNQQVRFSSAFPVDADTGEAWDRQPKRGNSHATSITSNTSGTSISGTPADQHGETSFDRAWEDVENPSSLPAAQKKSSTWKFWRRVLPLEDSASVQNDSSIQSPHDMSVSMTSDKTPKISNVNEAARAKRIRQQTGLLTCHDRWEQLCYKLFKTWQGRVVLLLVLILIAAVIWTAMVALGEEDSKDGPASTNEALGDPQRPFFPEFPTASPVETTSPSDSVPDTVSSQPTISPESRAPVEAPPTDAPTFAHTSNPTTAMPTGLDATSSPTRTPTLTPTRAPTLRPTRLPTSRPTLSPIHMPTQSPAADFLGSPSLASMGNPIVGSAPGQRFGQTVALSSDGSVMAIGAPFATNGSLEQTGMVQVFEWISESWQPRGLPIMGRNDGDQFGSDLGLSGDGSILVVAEPTHDGPAGTRSGNVRTFLYDDESSYVSTGAELPGTAAADHFGFSIALSQNGKRLVVGAPYHDNGGPNRNVSGHAIVYDFQEADATWLPMATMTGTSHLDWFGHEVGISDDGLIMCVGAPRNVEFGGYVRCHNLDTNEVMGEMITNDIQPRRYDDMFGHALKIDSSRGDDLGTQVAIGAPGKNRGALDGGAVAVFEFDKSKQDWNQVGEPIVANSPEAEDEFGFSVDFRKGILVVGSPGRGQVERYVFVEDGRSSEWRRHSSTLIGSLDSNFGHSVSFQDDQLVVGSAETAGENTGMVEVFRANR